MSCLVLCQVIAREPNYILWRDAERAIFPHTISERAGGDELDEEQVDVETPLLRVKPLFPATYGGKITPSNSLLQIATSSLLSQT